MRRYWSHAAMLLLGVSLSVGFYEGRRLVKNTAKALTAATSITASASRRGRDRDRADEEDPDGELGVSAAAGEEDHVERKRKRSRSAGAVGVEGGEPSRTDKLNALRQRQRHRFSAGRTATVPVLTTPDDQLDKDMVVEPQIDTAAELQDP